MKAIILAAGKGTRLGGLTEDIPKPMLPIKGKPLLEYIILYLKCNGITEIGINLFTMADQILDYFGDGEKFNIKIEYSHEPKLMGTAGSLLFFRNWLGCDDFLVVYGDIITNQPLTQMIELHKRKNAFATLLLHRRKVSNSFIELNEASRIVEFKERPGDKEVQHLCQLHPEGFLVNSALQILSREALTYIEEHKCFDLPRDVYAKVLHVHHLYGYILEKERIAVDSPERYELAQNADFISTTNQH